MMRRSLIAAALTLAIGAPLAAAAVPNHPFVGVITGGSIGPGDQFGDACGVAVDSVGDVYVSDYYRHRVVVFNKQRAFLAQISNVDLADGPCDLAVDSKGALYVNDYHGGVSRLAPSRFPPLKGTTYGAPVTIDQGSATGIAVDPATDNLYVNNRTHVSVYEPSGAPLLKEGAPLQIGQGSLDDSYGLAISSYGPTAGRVYAGDAATEAVKAYDPQTNPDDPVQTFSGEGTPQGRFYLNDTDLAVDPVDGHLYVADNLQPHFEAPEAVVDEFSAKGLYRGPVPHPLAGGEGSFLIDAEPTSLAIGSGNLYVTSGNFENGALYIFGPPAGALTQILSVTEGGGGEGTVKSLPAGISCGGVCEGEFDQGSTVVLVAAAAPGSAFAGWSNCPAPEGSSCAVVMSAARAVEAEFEVTGQEGALAAAPEGPSDTGFGLSIGVGPPVPAAEGSRRANARRPKWRNRRNRRAHGRTRRHGLKSPQGG